MAIAIGSLTLVSVGSSTANLQAPAATGGSGSVTYQYYRSTVSGFTPGSANAISGATNQALSDSGLTPGTTYYYEVVATDSLGSTASTPQLQVVTTAASPQPNQFSLAPYLGMLDLRFNGDTLSVIFDPAGSGTLVAGQAVKFSIGSSNVPLIVPSTGSADVIAGFVNYDIKSAVFNPGDSLEISMDGNVMFLYASLAIQRGQQVTSLPAASPGGCNGGVVPVAGGSLPIVGIALDTAPIGSLVRIKLMTPSGLTG